ncbi:type II secretion system protein GspC [Vibrio albus]|uniref:Type II secretion system protein GspC n=1 Tax=Vibrio albus TaxID=2200953 RepID=A0A2U3B825_9VIBR|nr:type II secretion system protein GspC [Vibrio albus]PWI32960.1 type II secretion system protein GspC [Vibrio albus]
MSLTLSQSPKIAGFLNGILQFLTAYQARLSTVVVLIFLSVSAWIAGELIWGVTENGPMVSQWSPVPVSGKRAGAQSGQDISQLVNANLFGEYSEKAVSKPVAPVVTDAPKTRLNLVLVGVVSSSAPETSLAVIANRGSQATYGIGEEIEGTRATLKSVLVDRVIIDNAGRFETLMLEGIEYKRLSGQPVPKVNRAALRGGNNPGTLESNELDQIRQEITEDPQKIMQYIRLSQVKEEDEIIGYRVSPGSKRALFDSVGLQEGDVATTLNGEDLTDPKAMGRIWQNVSDLTELNLTVIRDGQPYDIYIVF